MSWYKDSKLWFQSDQLYKTYTKDNITEPTTSLFNHPIKYVTSKIELIRLFRTDFRKRLLYKRVKGNNIPPRLFFPLGHNLIRQHNRSYFSFQKTVFTQKSGTEIRTDHKVTETKKLHHSAYFGSSLDTGSLVTFLSTKKDQPCNNAPDWPSCSKTMFN